MTTRMTAFLIATLACWGCASAPLRPASASSPVRPAGAVVRVPERGFMLRLPHDRWSAEDGGDAAAIVITHARGASVTVTTRPIDPAGFVATIDALRREAVDAGCVMRRGGTRYVTDQFGRRATVAARRTTDDGTEDGEITLLAIDGVDGGIVVSAWWPETPSSWTADDVHAIVDSIRPLPGA